MRNINQTHVTTKISATQAPFAEPEVLPPGDYLHVSSSDVLPPRDRMQQWSAGVLPPRDRMQQ